MSQPCVRSLRAASLVLGGVILFSASVAQPAAEQNTAPGTVTYTKDIAPILQKNCQQCHQPDSIGPMSLASYQETRPWARSIKNKVMAGEMPPYRYDRNVGIQRLKHDLRLSEKEIQTIVRWVDNGAPQGNPADMPPAATFPNANEWAFERQFGPPDVIVKTKPYTLPARGQDVWWRPIVQTGVTKDRCIRAIAVKPSSKDRAAAHHANTKFVQVGENTGGYVRTLGV